MRILGELVWRLWTIPGPGEFGSSSWPGDSYLHGGGTTWMPGTYDPQLNTVYWGTGNAAPDYDGDVRPGDDLYTASVLAIDPDTGKLKWYFQFTPHDLYDYDGVQTPVLIDRVYQGKRENFWSRQTGMDFSMFSIVPTASFCQPPSLPRD